MTSESASGQSEPVLDKKEPPRKARDRKHSSGVIDDDRNLTCKSVTYVANELYSLSALDLLFTPRMKPALGKGELSVRDWFGGLLSDRITERPASNPCIVY